MWSKSQRDHSSGHSVCVCVVLFVCLFSSESHVNSLEKGPNLRRLPVSETMYHIFIQLTAQLKGLTSLWHKKYNYLTDEVFYLLIFIANEEETSVEKI